MIQKVLPCPPKKTLKKMPSRHERSVGDVEVEGLAGGVELSAGSNCPP